MEDGFTIMAKQRLRVVQRELFEQLDAIRISFEERARGVRQFMREKSG